MNEMTKDEVIDSALNQLKYQKTIHKCRKGHSYRPDKGRTEYSDNTRHVILKRKWTCINCGRHLEKK